MKNELIKLANHLDEKGLHTEANYLDVIIKRAHADNYPDDTSNPTTERLERLEKGLATLQRWVAQEMEGRGGPMDL